MLSEFVRQKNNIIFYILVSTESFCPDIVCTLSPDEIIECGKKNLHKKKKFGKYFWFKKI
jgi:CO dehydrogenase/acetyl-CoA synthase beta subunit